MPLAQCRGGKKLFADSDTISNFPSFPSLPSDWFDPRSALNVASDASVISPCSEDPSAILSDPGLDPLELANDPPLTIRSTSSTHRRAAALELRSKARRLNSPISKALGFCGLSLIHGESAARLVRGEDKATLHGVSRCANPWACPVCAPKLAAARAEALRPQIAQFMAKGYSAWLLTFTLRHEKGNDLSEMFKALSKAWKSLTSGREWAALRSRGPIEYIKGMDNTYGNRFGWHPHMHILILVPASHGDGSALASWFLERWVEAVEALGFSANRAALDAQRANSPEEAAAYAVRPAAVYEAGAMALKRSSGKGSGLTPFEILELAVKPGADPRMVALWRDYVRATKGKRQTTTSRGLTLKPDKELSEEQVADPKVVAFLSRDALLDLDGKPLADVLEATERSPADGLALLKVFLGKPVLYGSWWLPEMAPGVGGSPPRTS